jgi:hypothetical protein
VATIIRLPPNRTLQTGTQVLRCPSTLLPLTPPLVPAVLETGVGRVPVARLLSKYYGPFRPSPPLVAGLASGAYLIEQQRRPSLLCACGVDGSETVTA